MSRPSVIPAGVTVTGDLLGRGDLRVFGRVEGPIAIDGLLILEPGGVIRGDVRATRVVVRGALVGDVDATEVARLEPGANVRGDVRAERVSVDDGARLKGRVRRAHSSAGEVIAVPIVAPPLEAERCRRRAALRGEPFRADQAWLPGVTAVDFPAPPPEPPKLEASVDNEEPTTSATTGRRRRRRRGRPLLEMPARGRQSGTRRAG